MVIVEASRHFSICCSVLFCLLLCVCLSLSAAVVCACARVSVCDVRVCASTDGPRKNRSDQIIYRIPYTISLYIYQQLRFVCLFTEGQTSIRTDKKLSSRVAHSSRLTAEGQHNSSTDTAVAQQQSSSSSAAEQRARRKEHKKHLL